jgi:UDP-3-O-[3-hydroxymyristoyl] glucosamine N-acyltransferase
MQYTNVETRPMTMLLWDMVAPLANASVVELAFLVVVPEAAVVVPAVPAAVVVGADVVVADAVVVGPAVVVEPSVVVGADVVVADAVVVGPAVVVEPSVVVGGDVVVADAVVVGPAVVVEPSVVVAADVVVAAAALVRVTFWATHILLIDPLPPHKPYTSIVASPVAVQGMSLLVAFDPPELAFVAPALILSPRPPV